MTINYINTSSTVAGTATTANAATLTIIAAGVTRVSTGGAALSNLTTTDNCDVRVDGTLIGNQYGVSLLSDGTTGDHSLVVGLTGVVLGHLSEGARVSGPEATLFNYGQIGSDQDDGVGMNGPDCMLTNYGEIYSVGRIGVTMVGDDPTLENHGTITSIRGAGIMLISATGTYLVNTGTISGPTIAVWGSGQTDRIVNQGTISGEIRTFDGNDVFSGTGGGAVDVDGGNGLDTLRGGALDDVLAGGPDADRLVGNAGDDILIGGGAADVLRGGAGADQFVYTTLADMGSTLIADRITDFASGEDVIDLSAIPGNFTFIGGAAFSSVIDQVRYSRAAGHLLIDHNGDGVADFFLQLTPGKGLSADDLIL